jgi:membrane-associated PAP2 superfamily phosphatase
MKARPAAVTSTCPLAIRAFAGMPVPWPSSNPLREYVAVHLLLVPAVLAACAWLTQYGRLDMTISGLFFDPASHAFAWRHAMWLDVLGHEAARALPVFVGALAFAAGLAGFALAPLRPWRAVLLTLGAAMVAGPLLIAQLKTMTTLHCPVDEQEFGGIVSYALDQAGPFWAASRHSAGHCSPSGHAGGGYDLLALYFAGWAAGRPVWRWQGLAIGVAAGLLFSIVRLMQGAHFASATLWSAAVDWTVCALLFMPLLCRRAGLPP